MVQGCLNNIPYSRKGDSNYIMLTILWSQHIRSRRLRGRRLRIRDAYPLSEMPALGGGVGWGRWV